MARWEYNRKKYKWEGAGTILETGACIGKTYKKDRVPKKGATKVFSTFEYQKIRGVDAKMKTLSIDFTLTMRWLDSRIKRSRFSDQDGNDEIFLGHSAIDKIWTPDFRIANQTSFKANYEWFSIVSSGILGDDTTEKLLEMSEHEDEKMSTGVRIQYEIKTSVFCPFSYADYPMDRQQCNVSFGSGSLGAIFTLLDPLGSSHKKDTYEAANFDVTVNFFDNDLGTGENTIGMKIHLARLRSSYIMTYYIPSVLIVLVSEIGFVVPVTAIPGRIGPVSYTHLTLPTILRV